MPELDIEEARKRSQEMRQSGKFSPVYQDAKDILDSGIYSKSRSLVEDLKMRGHDVRIEKDQIVAKHNEIPGGKGQDYLLGSTYRMDQELEKTYQARQQREMPMAENRQAKVDNPEAERKQDLQQRNLSQDLDRKKSQFSPEIILLDGKDVLYRKGNDSRGNHIYVSQHKIDNDGRKEEYALDNKHQLDRIVHADDLSPSPSPYRGGRPNQLVNYQPMEKSRWQGMSNDQYEQSLKKNTERVQSITQDLRSSSERPGKGVPGGSEQKKKPEQEQSQQAPKQDRGAAHELAANGNEVREQQEEGRTKGRRL